MRAQTIGPRHTELGDLAPTQRVVLNISGVAAVPEPRAVGILKRCCARRPLITGKHVGEVMDIQCIISQRPLYCFRCGDQLAIVR